MFGALNKNEIEDVLSQQIIGRIGCHADGITYIVPISYAYDGKCIYARTYEGLKVDLMRKNPSICFQVDIMDNMANWKSVIAWGKYKEITDADERNEAIKKLISRKIPGIASKMVQLSPLWPFSTIENHEVIDGIIFCIVLDKKTGRFEKSDPIVF